MGLREVFLQELLTKAHVIEHDNWDYHLFPDGDPMQFDSGYHAVQLAFILDNIDRLEWLFGNLQDELSRQTLLSILLYRSLGPAHVRLPVSTPEYWKQYNALAKSPLEKDVEFSGFSLNKYRGADGLTLLSTAPGMMANYGTGQYFQEEVRPEPGDHVLDGGACWGDTAVRFAHEVGSEGRVFSFEISDENLRIFNKNLSLNPEVAGRIETVNNALSQQSGELVRFVDASVASTLNAEGRDVAETLAIDDFASQERVDFVKMDIEGAETAALHGAAKTLRAQAPKLAISVYHRPEDLFEIPQLIQEINPAYRLTLRHHTATPYETVVYARVA